MGNKIIFIMFFYIAVFIWIGLLQNDIYKHKDKRLHLLISFLLALPFGLISLVETKYPWFFIGIGFSILIGLIKEFVYDKMLKKGTFEIGDILADIVGSAILMPITVWTIAFFMEVR